MRAAAVWILVLVLALPVAGATAVRPPAIAAPDSLPLPAPAATNPAALRTLFTAPGLGEDLAVDGARGRILVTATFDLAAPDPTSNLLVLDLAGNLVGNLSLGRRAIGGPHRFALDPASGLVYVPTVNSTILKVDPAIPRVLVEWPEPYLPDVVTFAAGALYAQTLLGDILRISPADGSLLGNWTVPVHTLDIDLLVEPTGRWLFFSDDNYSWRIDTSDGSRTRLGWQAVFALSSDAARVFILEASTGFAWSWVSNGTIDAASFGVAPNPNPFRANPVTGVLAFALDGHLLDPDTGDGIPMDPGGALEDFADIGWTSDGTALIVLNRTFGSTYPIVVRAWSGSPWLEVPPSWLLNPHYDPACASIVSTSLMVPATIHLTRDGAPYLSNWTWHDEACFNQDASWGPSTLADGVHTGRVTGLDRLGQPLDENVTFETDGTPPQITVTSPTQIATVPYTLTGRLTESHPDWMTVNGTTVVPIGGNWSIPEALVIGNNTFRIDAADALGNYAYATVTVRYWPEYLSNLTVPAEHFQVSIPPNWIGQTNYTSGNTTFSAALIGPPATPSSAFVVVLAEHEPNALNTSAYVLAVSATGQAFLVAQGATLLRSSYLTEVDGHPAATFEARILLAGVYMRYVQTVVASATWGRVYVLTIAVPEANWPQYAGTWAWILGGFHIEVPQPTGPSGSVPWLLIAGITVGAGGVATLGAVLWIGRRRKRPAKTSESKAPKDEPQRKD